MALMQNSEIVTAPIAATNTACSNVSTAAVAVGGPATFRFVALTVDIWVLFGPSTVAAASTANGLVIPAGSYMDFRCGESQNTHFRAITAAAAGTLSWALVGA
jgi:hypothetical protein